VEPASKLTRHPKPPNPKFALLIAVRPQECPRCSDGIAGVLRAAEHYRRASSRTVATADPLSFAPGESLWES
jgi:hypothetical protein